MTIIHHGLGMSGLAGPGAGSTDKTQGAQDLAAQLRTQAEPGWSSQPGEVEITPTAQLLATVAQQIATVPDVNQGRVDSIRQGLSNGSYQIDASRIGDGVLAAQKIDAQVAAGANSGLQSNTARAFATTAQLGSDRS